MIKNPDLLERFERELVKKERPDYMRSLKIFEGLWKEGMKMGVLPLENPLEGIETDIRIARILNSLNV